MTQSNDPISTSQIVNYFVTHFANQNDKVQFDCLVALDMFKTTCLDWHGDFWHLSLLGIFWFKNLVGKTVNCKNDN